MKKSFSKIFGITTYTFVVLFLFIANVFVYGIIHTETSRPPLTVYYLDVGQGDATLIETGNGNRVLIDAGGGRKTAEKIAEMLPFYDQKIDVVIVTHPHSDHIDGLAFLLDYVDVGLVLESGSDHSTLVVESYKKALEEHSVKKIYARRGMTVKLSEDIFIFILFPDVNVFEMDTDNASVWAKLSYGETDFLFSGDSFLAIENYMVEIDGEKLASNIFQAGHHGSKTSNGRVLLRAVMPDYVVISAGENNRFGHPHMEAMETFSYVGAEILKTYMEGDIVFISDGEDLQRIK